MPLGLGAKLGPFEILSPLGAGGMGEVYRARDTRLDREVAIKVLPASIASDPSLRQRLEREAKALSKLSHPHICTLYDIGHQDGVDYLVMELVDGETLEQRLIRGPLPSEQTIRYGAQIADALSKAHRLGFMHRDLKPANIMLTKGGAKLMDFGLAKESGSSSLVSEPIELTAEQSKLTGNGMLVGTFQYMSPEQLEGKDADTRTDIFALGEVIYEMATGKAAFCGKSRASLIAAILSSEPPPITQLQPLTPPALERIVRKCLAKDPDERWQSASDLASELRWLLEGGSQAGIPAPIVTRLGRSEIAAWTLAAVALAVAIILAALHFRESSKPPRVIRAQIAAEDATFPIFTGDFAGPPVLSPDGNRIAYVATREGTAMLWVRSLSGDHAHPIPGTDGAIFPFWAPDGRAIGFFAGSKLKTVSLDGGLPIDVANAPFGRGGSWSNEGTILFASDFQTTLSQVPAAGGAVKPATVMDKAQHDSHRWPLFLPDGKHFLYLAVTHTNNRDPKDAIYYASLDGKENHVVVQALTNVTYAAGRLLFVRDRSLMAQLFDVKTGTLHGEAERVAEDVLLDGTVWRAQFDASNSGMLVYAMGGLTSWQAMWYDRSGKRLGAEGEKALNLVAVRLSPDGSRLATEAGEASDDIWVYDRKRQVNTRLTFGPGTSSSPVWSPDGKWIAYNGVRGNDIDLLRKPVNGLGTEELLLKGNANSRNPLDWSPDNQFLLFAEGDLQSTGQVWLLPMVGDRKPIPLIQNQFVVSGAKFSPDGRWLAYSSNDSGRQEVYVTSFRGASGKWQISTTGGVQPMWRRDGKELFYWSADNGLTAVPITLKNDGIETGSPHQLFRFNNPVGIVGVISPYDFTPDGQRFVLLTTPEDKPRAVALVSNWAAELKQK